MILVFGKTGQVAACLDQMADTRCLCREEANLRHPNSCASLIYSLRPEAVINAAGYTDVEGAEKNQNEAYIVNALAPQKMALACENLKIPFLHFSSDFVFDGSTATPYQPLDTPAPINFYGKSKLEAEKFIRANNSWNVILRTSWVFSAGPGDFVGKIIDKAKHEEGIRVVGDQFGCPTPANALAEAAYTILKRLQQTKSVTGTFHFCGQPTVSRADFARAIISCIGKKNRVIDAKASEFSNNAARPYFSALDCENTMNSFGVDSPEWLDALKHYLNEN